VGRLDNKKTLLERANTVLLLGILWSALAVCVIGALSYDMANWFSAWWRALGVRSPRFAVSAVPTR
jgi:expansin (peptidoglycan-binding protein)